MAIAYSDEAEISRAYLLRRENDIDIFVEDAGCQNMYVRLFNRMLEGRGKISTVYPLHKRSNVIEHCRNQGRASDRPRFYLIDGDLDLLLGNKAPQFPNLYRLKVYCSENLLLSESAAVTLATESSTNARPHELAASLSLRNLLEPAVSQLLPLFVVYGIAHELNSTVPTVSVKVQSMLAKTNDPTTLSRRLIRGRMLATIRSINQEFGRDRYRRVRNRVVRRLRNRLKGQSTASWSSYISGKTYLLPLLQLQLVRATGFRDSIDGLKVRLAQYCEVGIDPNLRRKLRSALK